MGAVTGILAGLVTAAGAVALYRYAERRTRDLRERLDPNGRARRHTEVIDFERDPETGVYRSR